MVSKTKKLHGYKWQACEPKLICDIEDKFDEMVVWEPTFVLKKLLMFVIDSIAIQSDVSVFINSVSVLGNGSLQINYYKVSYIIKLYKTFPSN